MAKKRSNYPKWKRKFFLKKKINKTFMYLSAPFIWQNFNKIFRANPELWGCAIFRPKMAHLSWTKFFWYKSLLLCTFHCAKLKRNSTFDPGLWGCAISEPKMVHLHQIKNFMENINIIFIYLLAPSIVQNFKKILTADPELWGCAIFGSKMVRLPKWELFQKICSKALFLSFVSIYRPKIKVTY